MSFGTSFRADIVVLCDIFVGSVILSRKFGVRLVVSENFSFRVVWCNIFELRAVLCRIFTLRARGSKLDVMLRMNGEWRQQGKQNVVQRMQCNMLEKSLYMVTLN